MFGLKNQENYVIAEGTRIEYGIWESDAIEKWAIFADDSEEASLYAIDDGYSVVEYNSKPDDYSTYKYFFVDGDWVRNPHYIEPLPPTETRVAILEADMDMMSDYSLELLYQISLLQLGMDESDVEE